jgi:transcriptional regulator with XRE-family HTH domain
MTGKELKALRTARKLTQQQAARKLQIAQGTISKWESGHSTIPGAWAQVIALLLGKRGR